MKYGFVGALAAAIAASNALSISGVMSGLFTDWVAPQLPLGTSEELRLLELSETDSRWVTEEEMLALKREGRNFIDVTDYQGHYDRVSVKAATKYPTEVGYSGPIKKLSKELKKKNMRDTLTEFSSFHTRYAKSDYGLNSSLWLYDHVKAIVKDRPDITVSIVEHDWKQKSLIATFNGTAHPDHVVIVGAHQDSINLLFPSLLAAPGADDDGSGTVTILEVFRVLVESDFQPSNTLEFHWYSAEELGLWGSQDIFTRYADNGVDVKAMLQQDMTGYSKGTLDSGEPDSLAVIIDYVDQNLTSFVKLVVDEYCDIPYVEAVCGYACSDHASATKVGYPSAFVIESELSKSDSFVHTTLDTVDRLDFDHMYQHAKLTLGYAYELAQAKL
jgi:leucyl aminopeptidase